MKSFLDRMGIYGYNISHERAMLASILTGTPVLLIGHIGEAKTKAAEMFATLLDEPFQKIAADKVQFEDMIGFPNPKSLGEGEVDYVRTKLSIWDKRFVLIDEISRCNPQMQNKFLELVLDRQVMGLPTDVRWVWSTMNPLDYPGSQPLDEALAGRMGYVLNIERIVSSAKSNDILTKVVSTKNYSQTPALSHWTDSTRSYKPAVDESLKHELQNLMYKAGSIFISIEDNWQQAISRYVASFCTTLKSNGQFIDGRRMTMIKNNIIANIAIATIWNGKGLSIPELKQLCQEVVPMSIPWIATGIAETFDIQKFRQACKVAEGQLDSSNTLMYKIVTEQDPVEKALLFLNNRNTIDQTSAVSMLKSIYEEPRYSPEDKIQVEARVFMLRLALANLFSSLPDISAEVVGMTTKNYPIKFITEFESTSNYINVSLENVDQLQEITDLYNKYIASNKSTEWAIAYFAFYGGKETLELNTVRERITAAETALADIKKTFYSFTNHAKKQKDNSTSRPRDNASLALEEIFKAKGEKSDPNGRGTETTANAVN